MIIKKKIYLLLKIVVIIKKLIKIIKIIEKIQFILLDLKNIKNNPRFQIFNLPKENTIFKNFNIYIYIYYFLKGEILKN